MEYPNNPYKYNTYKNNSYSEDEFEAEHLKNPGKGYFLAFIFSIPGSILLPNLLCTTFFPSFLKVSAIIVEVLPLPALPVTAITVLGILKYEINLSYSRLPTLLYNTILNIGCAKNSCEDTGEYNS